MISFFFLFSFLFCKSPFSKQQTDKETVFLQAGSEINEMNNLVIHMKLKYEIDVDESLQSGLCFIYFLLWGS